MQFLALHLHLCWFGHRHLLISAGAVISLDIRLAVVFLFITGGLMMCFLLEVTVIIIEIILESSEVEI